jgi:hypothetical protein
MAFATAPIANSNLLGCSLAWENLAEIERDGIDCDVARRWQERGAPTGNDQKERAEDPQALGETLHQHY